MNNLIDRKWFTKYTQKYNITKETLDKGIVLNDNFYIFTKDNRIFVFNDSDANYIGKGFTYKYFSDYSVLSNIWFRLSNY